MSVYRKILLVILAAGLLLALLLALLSTQVLLKRVEAAEAAWVADKVHFAEDYLSGELAAMERQMSDWAAWDDAYAFMAKRDPRFIASSYTLPTFINNRWDAIVFLDKAGKVAAGMKISPDRKALVPVSEAEADLCRRVQARLRPEATREGVNGWLSISGQPCFISAHNIITSDYTGPSRGAMVGWRALSPDEVARMRQVSHLDLSLVPASDASAVDMPSRVGVRAVDSQRILGLRLYEDVFGQPLLTAQVALHRDMRGNFIDTLVWFLASFALGMLAIGLLAMALLQRLVLSRLSALHDHLALVESTRELSRRAPAAGNDEVSRLSRAANNLLQALQEDIEARERLMDERRRMDEQVRRMQKFENLGVLAGGIAHDFNNLLAGLFSYLEVGRVALDKGELERARACLEKGTAVGHRATDLTQQLLTFSKGGAPLKRVADLGDLIKREVEFSLSGSAVRPRLALAADLWLCSMDVSQVAQVIDNLVINARQAMAGAGTLQVEAGNLAPGRPLPSSLAEGPYVWASFSDQGQGIPEDLLPHIFDPFFTTKSGGTGLGLAIAYSVLERHGGAITASNSPQGGAVLTLYLPALPQASRAELHPAAPAAPPEGGSARILVMDDEADGRDSLVLTLETLGYQAQGAPDGRSAVEAWRRGQEQGRPFQAVIMDLTIPGGMGGREAMARLLELDPAARGIVSSGYTEEGVLQDIQRHGFMASLQKPYEIAQLRETLRTVLGQ